jgi:hypothetical protein
VTGILDEEENGDGNIDNGVDEETVEHLRITIHWVRRVFNQRKKSNSANTLKGRKKKTLRMLSFVHTSFSCNM